MKKFNFFMLLTILLVSSKGYTAPMYISSYVTLGFVNVPDDIIIEPGGTLNITGPVHMGSPSTPAATVIIQDGGKLYSNGGSLIAYGPGHFQGIVVEPTAHTGGNTSNAVELINFTINGAQLGLKIEYSRGPTLADLNINQRVEMTQSTFTGCSTNVLSTSIGGTGLTNQDNSHNPVIFNNCDFLGGSPSWPNHFIDLKDLRFIGCNFTTGVEIILHMNNVNDLLVDNCSFNGSVNSVGLLFHGLYDNATVTNNTFNTGQSGASITWGVVSNSVFSGNHFIDSKVGITIGNESGVLTHFSSWVDGGVSNVQILNNVFENNDIGIQSGASGFIMSYYSDNLTIVGNEFQACIRGVLFNGENINITVNCNDFHDTQNSGIEVDDLGLSSFVLNGADDYNRFYGTLGADIRNINPMGTFSYEHLTGTSYPFQPTIMPNVTPIPVLTYLMCE